MITWKLIAIQYLNPHAPLIEKMNEKFWTEWFKYSLIPQIWWTTFSKQEWNQIETCLVHWKRIEYKIQNCNQNTENYKWDDIINRINELKKIREQFYTYEKQKEIEFSWIILDLLFSLVDEEVTKINEVLDSYKEVKKIDRQINFIQIDNDITYNINIITEYSINDKSIIAQIDVNDRFSQRKWDFWKIILKILEFCNKNYLINLLFNNISNGD